MRFHANVHVSLKPTVNDPQGNAIARALKSLGFDDVQDVRTGKYITLALEAQDSQAASTQVKAMCEKLLANPIIESYHFQLEGAEAGSTR